MFLESRSKLGFRSKESIDGEILKEADKNLSLGSGLSWSSLIRVRRKMSKRTIVNSTMEDGEKTFIAQEQPYLKRLWIINDPGWMISYKSQMKRNRMAIPGIFALGASSDEEAVDLIGCSNNEARIHNTLFASVHNADEECGAWWRNRNVGQYIEKVVKSIQFLPSESIMKCLEMYVFPGISGPKKARIDQRVSRYALHMLRGEGDIVERPYGDREARPIECYLDASITTNNLQKAFSTRT
ncbi:DNA-directed RNA polymerases IV and V subunit 2, partial [Mucuna pruriens]